MRNRINKKYKGGRNVALFFAMVLKCADFYGIIKKKARRWN